MSSDKDYYEVCVQWEYCAIIKVPKHIASDRDEADSLVMENCICPEKGTYVPESFEITMPNGLSEEDEGIVTLDYEEATL